jgi:hypothetical protein
VVDVRPERGVELYGVEVSTGDADPHPGRDGDVLVKVAFGLKGVGCLDGYGRVGIGCHRLSLTLDFRLISETPAGCAVVQPAIRRRPPAFCPTGSARDRFARYNRSQEPPARGHLTLSVFRVGT